MSCKDSVEGTRALTRHEGEVCVGVSNLETVSGERGGEGGWLREGVGFDMRLTGAHICATLDARCSRR